MVLVRLSPVSCIFFLLLMPHCLAAYEPFLPLESIAITTRPKLLTHTFFATNQYFPADYAVIVMIILYMFWATTKGIISLGIRFLWVHLYKFRRAATQPQGLLAATMLWMLSLAALSYTLTMAVAPEYSMFGSQKYVCFRAPLFLLIMCFFSFYFGSMQLIHASLAHFFLTFSSAITRSPSEET